MRAVLAVAVVSALAWVASPAGADAPRSLGEVAAQTKKKKPVKVITEDDLRAPRHGGSYSQPAAEGGTSPTATTASPVPAGSPAPGAAAAPAEKPKTEDELRADREKEWRDKMTAAQADVATWTGEVTRLQASLSDNTVPMYGAGRAARSDALENAKRQLAAANQAVENLQEEGRRNRFR